MFSMGKGAAVSYSRKMKMNTRSSTETKLVGAEMFMPEMLWSPYTIQLQGYEAKCITLYQDNISSQLLMKNGLFFKWEEDTTHQSKVLLHQRQNR
jgi:hypothetical protein